MSLSTLLGANHLIEGVEVLRQFGKVHVGLDDVPQGHSGALQHLLEVSKDLPSAVLDLTLSVQDVHALAHCSVDIVASPDRLGVLPVSDCSEATRSQFREEEREPLW
jgi:hypothetical protein